MGLDKRKREFKELLREENLGLVELKRRESSLSVDILNKRKELATVKRQIDDEMARWRTELRQRYEYLENRRHFKRAQRQQQEKHREIDLKAQNRDANSNSRLQRKLIASRIKRRHRRN